MQKIYLYMLLFFCLLLSSACSEGVSPTEENPPEHHQQDASSTTLKEETPSIRDSQPQTDVQESNSREEPIQEAPKPACQRHDDCPKNQWCTKQQCRSLCSDSVPDGYCLEGQACVKGKCVRPACSTQYPRGLCPPETTCLSGSCLPKLSKLAPALSERRRIFLKLWDKINKNYGTFKSKNIKWEYYRDYYLKQLEHTKSFASWFRILQLLVHQLKDGHNSLYSKYLYQQKYYAQVHSNTGFCATDTDKGLTVWKTVASAHPMIQKGDIILAIDGKTPQQRLVDFGSVFHIYRPGFSSPSGKKAAYLRQFSYFNHGEIGLRIKRGTQELLVDIDVLKNRTAKQTSFLSCKHRILPKGLQAPTSDKPSGGMLNDQVYYIVLDDFMGKKTIDGHDFKGLGKELEKMIRDAETKKAKGLIIDLRNNVGGYAQLYRSLATFLVKKQTPTNTNKIVFNCRTKIEGLFSDSFTPIDPFRIYVAEKALFSGKIVILTSGKSVSAADFFPFLMQFLGEATIIGRPTAAAFGSSIAFPITSDITLQLNNFLCTNSKTGAVLEGNSVKPDISVLWKYKDVMEGKDSDIQAAIQFLTK